MATLDPWTLVAQSLSSHLNLAGRVTLTGTPSVDAKVDGKVDLRSLSLLLSTYRPSGEATLSASVTGPLATPNVTGFVQLQNGELLIRDPRLLFTDVHGTVRFAEGLTPLAVDVDR